jgi:ATP-dependent Lon protease
MNTDPIIRYTREAGVRSLERSIGAVARYKALEWAEFESELQDSNSNVQHLTEYSPTVDEQDLEKILGPPWWNGDELDRHDTIGVVYGLVVSGVGEVRLVWDRYHRER